MNKTSKVKRLGTTQQKILLLLLGGVALGLSGSPRRYFKILKEIDTEWEEIDRRMLKRSIQSLYKSKLVGERHNRDGSVTLVLTDEGRQRALTYNLDTITIKTPRKGWDYKWRIVIYDIPESHKKIREALHLHLRQLGMYELQRSVFVHPFDCQEQIEFIVEFYNVRKHVRYLVAEFIDNTPHLQEIFSLAKK